MQSPALAGPMALVLASVPVLGAELRPETVEAWKRYVSLTEKRIERELGSGEGFLALDFFEGHDRSKCLHAIEGGAVCILKRQTLTEERKPVEVPDGMIHHWYGAIFLPRVGLERVLDWVKTYENRQDYYPEVEDSRLISRNGDEYHIFLRLVRKKILTAHYDTEHDVMYRRHGDRRASSRSVATSIREIGNPGEANESERLPGNDRGFLWRLNSYWRFEERPEGTVVECESLSLSRSIPPATEWLIKTFINSVPRESLESTLAPIRAHVKP